MTSTTQTYLDMERAELVRLAGEQALLKQELTKLIAAKNRDVQALRNLPGLIGTSTDWYEQGMELLSRIKETETQLATSYLRLSEYSKLTGIS